MRPHRLVIIGASAGGVEALRALASTMPASLPAAVLVVVHRSNIGPSALPQVLSRAGALPAAPAVDGQPIEPGRIWVAVPDRHLLVHDGTMVLSLGPRENRNRPAIDPLMRTAARWCGPRAIAVILSGAMDDGLAGAAAIHSAGGVVLAQDPAEAFMPSMPQAVIDMVPDTQVATAAELGRIIADLAARRLTAQESLYHVGLWATAKTSAQVGTASLSSTHTWSS